MSARRSWRPGRLLPKGLYTRSLLIVILPMLLLQSVVALIFMERHWQQTTQRLSSTVAQDIAALIQLREAGVDPDGLSAAGELMGLTITFIPDEPLPSPHPPPVFQILERVLAGEMAKQVKRPFWLDVRNQLGFVEIRVKLDDEVLRVITRVSRAYASNSHIFLVWMAGASLLLITVSILFLRNQIKPILQLASAAENLGKGRPVTNFRPRGAREIRTAAQAFFAMRDRIERQIEQRTTMLAGVSHDLRTVLTRLRLQLAFLPKGPEVDDLVGDLNEMERMLEGYLAFARGDAGEPAQPMDAADLLDEIRSDAKKSGKAVTVRFTGDKDITAKPGALKRALANLVTNALRFGSEVQIDGRHEKGQFVITVDDNGPGIPDESREDVFRPFLRLDEARNLDHPGSGLGLTIARDIARGHGGDIELSKSPSGGLRARLHIPA